MENKVEKFMSELKCRYPMAEISCEVVGNYVILQFANGMLNKAEIAIDINYDMMAQCEKILTRLMRFGE